MSGWALCSVLGEALHGEVVEMGTELGSSIKERENQRSRSIPHPQAAWPQKDRSYPMSSKQSIDCL